MEAVADLDRLDPFNPQGDMQRSPRLKFDMLHDIRWLGTHRDLTQLSGTPCWRAENPSEADRLCRSAVTLESLKALHRYFVDAACINRMLGMYRLSLMMYETRNLLNEIAETRTNGHRYALRRPPAFFSPYNADPAD